MAFTAPIKVNPGPNSRNMLVCLRVLGYGFVRGSLNDCRSATHEMHDQLRMHAVHTQYKRSTEASIDCNTERSKHHPGLATGEMICLMHTACQEVCGRKSYPCLLHADALTARTRKKRYRKTKMCLLPTAQSVYIATSAMLLATWPVSGNSELTKFSASNGCRSSSPSPTPTNFTGIPS